MSGLRQTCNVFIEGGLIALLVFAPLSFGAVQPISDAILQVSVFVLAAAWVIQAYVAEPERRGPIPGRWAALLIGAFALLGALQWLGIASCLPGTVCPYTTRTALGEFLAAAVAFLLTVATIRKSDQAQRLVLTIVGVGAGIALLGIAQKFTAGDLLYWHWPPPPGSKPFGPYVSREQFAGYMEMAIPYAAALAFCLPQGATGMRAKAQGGGAAAAAGVMILALVLSFSRFGVIAFLASCVLLLVLHFPGSASRGRLAIGGGALAAVGLMAAWWLLWPCVEGTAMITATRRTIWRDALQGWRGAPVFGVGLGAFPNVFPLYKTASLGPSDVSQAMNEPIQLLVEMGIVGFAISALFFLFWFARALRGWRAAGDRWRRWMIAAGMAGTAAMLLHGLVTSSLHIPANAFCLAVILGVVYVLAERAPADGAGPADRTGEG